MAAVKTVQIVLMSDRSFPVVSASGADTLFEDTLRLLSVMNPAIPHSEIVLAIWEEGLRATQTKAKAKKFPTRLAHFKVVVPPKGKTNPRPIS